MPNRNLFSDQVSKGPREENIQSLGNSSKKNNDVLVQLYREISEQKEKVSNQEREVEKILVEAKDMKGLVIFGFIVLLIMVATLIIQAFNDSRESYRNLLEKIYEKNFNQTIPIIPQEIKKCKV